MILSRRRQFLTGALALGATADGHAHRASGRRSAQVHGLALHARRGLGRSAARRRRALDTAGARAAAAGRRHGPRRRHRRLGGRAATSAWATIVRAGHRRAPRPSWAHSVHVEVDGLEPDRWYWYRFRAGGEREPGRRARAPRPPPARRSTRAALRLRLLPAVRAGLLRRLPAHGRRRPRPRRLPRRLHLRERLGPRPRAQARRAGAVHARRLPRSATRTTRPTPTCRPRTPPARGS